MSSRRRHSAAETKQRDAVVATSVATVSLAAPAIAGERHKRLPAEEHFHWRAGEITRLESFSDVVFGFALTLLIISLDVPRSYDLLMADLRDFIPFAACFLCLVSIWRVHYIFSRRYGLEDTYTVFLNMVLLLVVLFYVYPLKFLFSFTFSLLTEGGDISFHHASVLVQLFSLGFAALYLLFTLMYAHAGRLSGKLELNAVERQKTLDMTQLNAAFCAVGILSFGVAFKNPIWGGLILNIIVPINVIHTFVAKKRIKRLLAAGA
ncbi:MAG: TMEM175 family protein [Terracidiphilus sp.]|jgi:uncharacterized membrane protein